MPTPAFDPRYDGFALPLNGSIRFPFTPPDTKRKCVKRGQSAGRGLHDRVLYPFRDYGSVYKGVGTVKALKCEADFKLIFCQINRGAVARRTEARATSLHIASFSTLHNGVVNDYHGRSGVANQGKRKSTNNKCAMLDSDRIPKA